MKRSRVGILANEIDETAQTGQRRRKPYFKKEEKIK
jgi:hypothetical protein